MSKPVLLELGMAQIEQGISKKYKNPSNKFMPDRVHKKTENN